jgi:hypothetical protein
MIPEIVHGAPVKLFAEVDPPRFPRRYPGDGPIEETCAFLISVSDEHSSNDRRYWVTCLGVTGRIMSGGMCYTMDAAMRFPYQEFDIEHLKWAKVEPDAGGEPSPAVSASHDLE